MVDSADRECWKREPVSFPTKHALFNQKRLNEGTGIMPADNNLVLADQYPSLLSDVVFSGAADVDSYGQSGKRRRGSPQELKVELRPASQWGPVTVTVAPSCAGVEVLGAPLVFAENDAGPRMITVKVCPFAPCA